MLAAVQVAWPFVWLLPSLMALNRLIRPGRGAAVYIPSTLLRYLAFKLTVDVQQLPALQACPPAHKHLHAEPVSVLWGPVCLHDASA